MSIESTPPGGGNIPKVKPQFQTQKATPVQHEAIDTAAKDVSPAHKDALTTIASQQAAVDASRDEIPTVSADVLKRFVETQRRGAKQFEPHKQEQFLPQPVYGAPNIDPNLFKPDFNHGGTPIDKVDPKQYLPQPVYGAPNIEPDLHKPDFNHGVTPIDTVDPRRYLPEPVYGAPNIDPNLFKPDFDHGGTPIDKVDPKRYLPEPVYGAPNIDPNLFKPDFPTKHNDHQKPDRFPPAPIYGAPNLDFDHKKPPFGIDDGFQKI